MEIKDFEEQEIILNTDLLVFNRVDTFLNTYSIQFRNFLKPIVFNNFDYTLTLPRTQDVSLIIRKNKLQRCYFEQLTHYILNLNSSNFLLKEALKTLDELYVFSNATAFKFPAQYLITKALQQTESIFLSIKLEDAVVGAINAHSIVFETENTLIINTTINGSQHHHDNFYSLITHSHKISDVIGLKNFQLKGEVGIKISVDQRISLIETINSVDIKTTSSFIDIQKYQTEWIIFNNYFKTVFDLRGTDGINITHLETKKIINNVNRGSALNLVGGAGVNVNKINSKTWIISISSL